MSVGWQKTCPQNGIITLGHQIKSTWLCYSHLDGVRDTEGNQVDTGAGVHVLATQDHNADYIACQADGAYNRVADETCDETRLYVELLVFWVHWVAVVERLLHHCSHSRTVVALKEQIWEVVQPRWSALLNTARHFCVQWNQTLQMILDLTCAFLSGRLPKNSLINWNQKRIILFAVCCAFYSAVDKETENSIGDKFSCPLVNPGGDGGQDTRWAFCAFQSIPSMIVPVHFHAGAEGNVKFKRRIKGKLLVRWVQKTAWLSFPCVQFPTVTENLRLASTKAHYELGSNNSICRQIRIEQLFTTGIEFFGWLSGLCQNQIGHSPGSNCFNLIGCVNLNHFWLAHSFHLVWLQTRLKRFVTYNAWMK